MKKLFTPTVADLCAAATEFGATIQTELNRFNNKQRLSLVIRKADNDSGKIKVCVVTAAPNGKFFGAIMDAEMYDMMVKEKNTRNSFFACCPIGVYAFQMGWGNRRFNKASAEEISSAFREEVTKTDTLPGYTVSNGFGSICITRDFCNSGFPVQPNKERWIACTCTQGYPLHELTQEMLHLLFTQFGRTELNLLDL